MTKEPVSRAGFTLVELLVTIGIISTPAALLLPVISRTKSRAQGAYCMNNSRQLAICF